MHSQVMHCDPSWPEDEDEQKCHSYSLLVFYNNTVYKNPHCARCNNIDIEDATLDCVSSSDCMRTHRSFKLPFAFSTLMDFSNGDCDNDELYDPLNNHCLKMQCTDSSDHNLSNCTIEDCRTKLLNVGEFFMGERGSLVENLTGAVYLDGEYKLINNSQASVCDKNFEYLSSITTPQKVLTFFVLLLSVLCLFAHITIYMLLPKLRNLPGRNLFSLSCSLFTAHLLFLLGAQVADHYGMCMMVGLSLHYFWLASFCWMNVMSLDVYITFRGHVHRRPDSGGTTFLKYSVYAWGVPFLIMTSALITQFTNIMPAFKPQYAGKMCWINNRDSLILFFLFPIGIIVLENVALFVGTSYGIYQQTKITKFAMKRSQSVKISSKTTERGLKNGNVTSSNSQVRCNKRIVKLI